MSDHVVEIVDARTLLDTAGTFLASEPVVHTVVITMAHRLADAEPVSWPRWFAVVRERATGVIVGVAMRTAPSEPYPLYVLPMPDAAALALVQALEARAEHADAVNGFLPAAALVAAGIAGGRSVVRSDEQRLFELGTLVPPAPASGYLRRATASDLDGVHAWFADFFRAANAQAGRTDAGHLESFARDDVERRVEHGEVSLWVDGGVPVHLTAANPPSFGVARIGPVYTPDQHRGHGYARAAVFGVARELQVAGHRVCLFADAANPVANAVYEGLGFRAVVSTAMHRFAP